ncbi:FkbM family methyltransferase [Rhizobium sp. FY34]|uniref:FkbM family methyltransferase n=1 Tax=Rhizobium sp. FY34 TaxID=2562309 RepID=UPI001484F945|nr:FkbM family methyltransferase [Rhizobium sp. FY34]
MMDAVSHLVGPVRIIDIGATEYDGGAPPSYAPIEASSASTVVAFDPSLDLEETSSRRTVLPFALGDGEDHVLHECAAPMTSSLLLPNDDVISRFENLAELCRVVTRSTIATVRLDALPEVENADFLKIDVQGATLLVLGHGVRTLESVLVVHTEVEFVPIYKGQPLFGEVSAFLSQCGFEFHHFRDFGAARQLAVSREFAFGHSTSRHLWADAVFVPSEERLKMMSDRQLLLTAAIMHDCYGAQDFAHACLTRVDQKSETGFAEAYRSAVLAIEARVQ